MPYKLTPEEEEKFIKHFKQDNPKLWESLVNNWFIGNNDKRGTKKVMGI